MKLLLLPAFAALAGLLPLPHDGYVLIKIVVAGVSLFSGLRIRSRNQQAFVILMLIAAVYNPIVPLHLSRSLWMLLDVGVAGYLLWLVYGTRLAVGSDVADQMAARPGPPPPNLQEKTGKVDSLMNSLLYSSIGGLLVIALLMFIVRR